MMVTIYIPGRLKGKVHHRSRALTVRGKTFVQTYKDPNTRNAMAIVAHFASQAMYGHKPIVGPVEARVSVVMSPPASWSKRRREAARFVTGKPDCDNMQKLIFDACNGIVYGDDSQIAFITFERRYSLTEAEAARVSFRALEAQSVEGKEAA